MRLSLQFQHTNKNIRDVTSPPARPYRHFRTCPPFRPCDDALMISLTVQEISCWQTDKHTNEHYWKQYHPCCASGNELWAVADTLKTMFTPQKMQFSSDAQRSHNLELPWTRYVVSSNAREERRFQIAMQWSGICPPTGDGAFWTKK